jgi:type II restriction enzyme
MNKLGEAKKILRELGLPAPAQNDASAYALIALCGIKPHETWIKATKTSQKVTKGIMAFVYHAYRKEYAPNARETFRRQVLNQFVYARIADQNPDNPKLPVNSPGAHYALTQDALDTIKTFGTKDWKKAVRQFKSQKDDLSKNIKKRKQRLIPVKLSNGKTLKLSAEKHNEVQAAVIHNFASRFAKEGSVLYLGDTIKKDLYVDKKMLKELGIPVNQEGKLPDVIIYDYSKTCLFLIETVTSHGPVSPKRVEEFEEIFKDCRAGKIYVTAFPDFAEFKKHSDNIAGETEVWLANAPEHMIHFKGDRFMKSKELRIN